MMIHSSIAPTIILVEPQLGENIGMVARAMANFGLVELRLVSPRDGWPNERARATASGSDHIIDAVKVYADLAAAVADLHYIFATTARLRDNFKSVRSPDEAARILHARAIEGQKTGILFGRERWGLTNDEVAIADEIVTFPVDSAYASLNVAQAVLLMSYEWIRQEGKGVQISSPALIPAPREQLNHLISYLDRVLYARGYFRTDAKKPKMMDNLRSLFTRPGFTEEEITVLRGVLRCLELFSPQKPRGAGAPDESLTSPEALKDEKGDL